MNAQLQISNKKENTHIKFICFIIELEISFKNFMENVNGYYVYCGSYILNALADFIYKLC